MITALSLFAISTAAIIFFSHRLLGYLRHFQERNYSPKLFKHWLLKNRIYDKKGSLIATLAAIAIEITRKSQVSSLVICAMAMAAFICLSLWEGDPRKVGYPVLLPTQRVIVTYGLALSLYSISFILSIATLDRIIVNLSMSAYWLFVIIAIQSSPLWMFLANTIVIRSLYRPL
jgi:UDP-N-acetylmuramoyl-tripeptide--D-alanyl-D-alanine ligase